MTTFRHSHPLITLRRLALLAVVYIRQSSPGQVRENWGSTTVQREQADLAHAYGWSKDAVELIEEDLGKSGRTTRGRSGWERMLHLIAGGRVGAVFAYDVKRISREVRDFSELLVLCRYHGVALVLDNRVVDPNNPGDAALAQMQATFAELDNRTRADTLRRAKHAKARQGAIVAELPVGWIRVSDDKHDFDPVARPAIDRVHATFRQVRSVRGTVRALNEAGILVPVRYRGRRLEFREATMARVRRFLLLPAYTGVVVFGQSEHLPEFGFYPSGMPRRRKVPIERQTRHRNRIPAYITEEEQEQFKLILKENGFSEKSRAGRGAALCQGIIECGRCGALLTVAYPAPNHGSFRYQCMYESVTYGAKPCCSVQGENLDAAVERIFLQVLRVPSVGCLTEALGETRKTARIQREHFDAERKRLAFQEQQARDRYENVDPRNRLLAGDLEKRLEQAMATKREFEHHLEFESNRVHVDITEQEIQELCESARDLARVWRHPVVTHLERKQLLRCVAERVVVNPTPVSIEGTIVWNSGEKTPFRFWRQAGVDQLIAGLHAEGLTVHEIRDRLAVGDPETGQRWTRTKAAIYQALRRLGVRPNSAFERSALERTEIRRAYGDGMTLRQIATQRNAAGSKTPTGKPWTASSVYNALGGAIGRIDRYEDLHRRLLADAKRRGLTNREAAEEFNEKQVPRAWEKPWSADAVRQRRRFLNAKAKGGVQ